MNQKAFEYDVAFSFTAQDEAIATQLNDLISDRLQTFIYSERQKEIAGRDGQEAFSEVYAEKARLVVVLYRESWGRTPWTRVEMDAIKNRSLNDGWDFTVFIPTETKPSVPPWLPKTRLYVGLERWGVEGAAAVIEARATESGAIVREETIKERAARHERKEELRRKQLQFLNSDEGVNAARAAYASVKAIIEGYATSLQNLNIQFKDHNDFAVVRGRRGINLVISWWPTYSNSLENVFFKANYYKGLPRLRGYMTFDKAVARKSRSFQYLLVRDQTPMYVEEGSTRREMTPENLADDLLSTLIEIVEREKD
ncbi:hypothetical protein [Rhizobium leguminosarum]|uniref:hypothetical protein n=1 Tax=Rhizobium leguminosarum TaxID=384 RepID=UPI003F982873